MDCIDTSGSVEGILYCVASSPHGSAKSESLEMSLRLRYPVTRRASVGGRRGVDGSGRALLVSSVSTGRVGVPALTGVPGRLDEALLLLMSLGLECIFLRQPIALSGMLSSVAQARCDAGEMMIFR